MKFVSAAIFATTLSRIGAEQVVGHSKKSDIKPEGVFNAEGLQSVILIFKDEQVTAIKKCRAIARQQGGSVAHVYGTALNGCALFLPEAAINALANHSDIASVELDHEVHALADETADSWGLDRVNQCNLPLDDMKSPVDATGVKVYIVDTGIKGTHVDFEGLIDEDSDCHSDKTYGNKPLTDGNGHGTHVASTTCGKQYGVAKDCQLCAVKTLTNSGIGFNSWVIGAVNFVMDNCAAEERCVANMSLGGAYSGALNNAVENAVASGVTFVVAAGNSNDDACGYSPASATTAVTVGSTTITDERSYFSSYGSCVDAFAPGSDIKAAWKSCDTCTNTISGTSMASPHVAGIAAGILGKGAATPAQVLAEIQESFTGPVTDNLTPGVGLATVLTSCGPSTCNIEKMQGNYNLKWNSFDYDTGKYKDGLVNANLRVEKPENEGKGVMEFSMCVLEGTDNIDSYLDSMVAVQTGFPVGDIIPIFIGTNFAGQYNCETEELMFGTASTIGGNEEDMMAFSLMMPAVKLDEGGVEFPGACSAEA